MTLGKSLNSDRLEKGKGKENKEKKMNSTQWKEQLSFVVGEGEGRGGNKYLYSAYYVPGTKLIAFGFYILRWYTKSRNIKLCKQIYWNKREVK